MESSTSRTSHISESGTRTIQEFRNDIDESLLECIYRNPGVRYRELLRIFHVGNGVLTYHLSILEKLGKIDQAAERYRVFLVYLNVEPRYLVLYPDDPPEDRLDRVHLLLGRVLRLALGPPLRAGGRRLGRIAVGDLECVEGHRPGEDTDHLLLRARVQVALVPVDLLLVGADLLSHHAGTHLAVAPVRAPRALQSPLRVLDVDRARSVQGRCVESTGAGILPSLAYVPPFPSFLPSLALRCAPG